MNRVGYIAPIIVVMLLLPITAYAATTSSTGFIDAHIIKVDFVNGTLTMNFTSVEVYINLIDWDKGVWNGTLVVKKNILTLSLNGLDVNSTVSTYLSSGFIDSKFNLNGTFKDGRTFKWRSFIDMDRTDVERMGFPVFISFGSLELGEDVGYGILIVVFNN